MIASKIDDVVDVLLKVRRESDLDGDVEGIAIDIEEGRDRVSRHALCMIEPAHLTEHAR